MPNLAIKPKCVFINLFRLNVCVGVSEVSVSVYISLGTIYVFQRNTFCRCVGFLVLRKWTNLYSDVIFCRSGSTPKPTRNPIYVWELTMVDTSVEGVGVKCVGSVLKWSVRAGLFFDIILSLCVASVRSRSEKVENVCVSAVCGSVDGGRKRVLSSAK